MDVFFFTPYLKQYLHIICIVFSISPFSQCHCTVNVLLYFVHSLCHVSFLLCVHSFGFTNLACKWDLKVFRAVRLQQCFIGDCYFRNLIR